MLLRLCETIAAGVILMSIKTYSELIALPTFEERYRYLRLGGSVGVDTFGFNRYLNQLFYQRSQLWKHIRDEVIIRDNGCDLGIDSRAIYGRIIIHHMNPITMDDLINESDFLTNPEFLICTSHDTHMAIHYGDEKHLMTGPIERTKNDTCPWRR